jgi:hypothetical protein
VRPLVAPPPLRVSATWSLALIDDCARRCTANFTVFRARNITAEFEPVVVQINLIAGAGLQNFNPSPILLPDGSAGLLFNAKNDSHCCNCDTWAPCLAYATAPSIFGAPGQTPVPQLQPAVQWLSQFAASLCHGCGRQSDWSHHCQCV